jgi:hypothetical protein
MAQRTPSGGAVPKPKKIGGRKVVSWGKQGYALGGKGKRLPGQRAPSAPSVPSMGGPLNTNTSSNQYSETVKKGNKPLGAGMISKVTPAAKAPPGPSGKQPTAPATQKPDPRDATYWANVAALGNQYNTEYGAALLNKERQTRDYTTEAARIESDRARARRNLAESLLGSGAIRSGSHRRTQTEGDIDHMRNRGRLDEDYAESQKYAELELADIASRLAPGTGSEYQNALLDWQERANAAQQEAAATGAPIYKSPGTNQRIKGINKRIDNLQGRLKKADSPKQKEKIQEQLKSARQERTKLVRKRNRRGER